jgi:GMP synthase-like glutamine amidotransferase
MSVLILKNVKHEGPGTIENFLRNESTGYKIIECSSDDIPQASGFDTLVIMGGPMSVNEADIYPYISRETGLAAEFMKKGKKVLGICLGAQIMAKALGAKVFPGPEKEIGWYDIELQNGGIKDQMMGRLAIHPREGDFRQRFKVFHWHGETFDIPEGAVRLAKSELYLNQAFKYGNHAYAFQFHIEVTKEMIYEWLKNEPVDMNTLSRETEMLFDDYTARAENFYRAFFK